MAGDISIKGLPTTVAAAIARKEFHLIQAMREGHPLDVFIISEIERIRILPSEWLSLLIYPKNGLDPDS